MFDAPVLKTAPNTIEIQQDIAHTMVAVHRPLWYMATAGFWFIFFSLLFLVLGYVSDKFLAASIVCGIVGFIGLILILIGVLRKFGSTKILFTDEATFKILDKKSLISSPKEYHFDLNEDSITWAILHPDQITSPNNRDFDLRLFDSERNITLKDLNQEEATWLNNVLEGFSIYSGFEITHRKGKLDSQKLDNMHLEKIENKRLETERIQREIEEREKIKCLENEEEEENEWSANHAKDYRLPSSYANPYQSSKHQEETIIDVVDSYDHDYDKYQPVKKKEKKKKNSKKKRK